MLSRPRIQPYAQYLMGASTAMISTTVAVVDPARITGMYVAGVGVILAACIAMALVWQDQVTSHVAIQGGIGNAQSGQSYSFNNLTALNAADY